MPTRAAPEAPAAARIATHAPTAGGAQEPWHAASAAAALAALASRAEGLAAAEAARRLAVLGPNRLPGSAPPSLVRRFVAQFRNVMVYVLLAAALVSVLLGHRLDAAVILSVVLLNAVIGLVQEGRAERALDAIRAMVDPRAAVRRDGRRVSVPAEAVVPGDIVLIEAGDRVPADLRLLSCRSLSIDEAILTGESLPAAKSPDPAPAGAALGERASMVFSGSFVRTGQGVGIAVATGAATEIGRIGTLLETVERQKAPLLVEIDRFAARVTAVVLAVSVGAFLFALLGRAYGLGDAFMAAVGLAVAAIPEELPAVLTITLAIGVRRMAERRAIVRRLPAVETLGAVSVICTDKTGTLTRNEMTARSVTTPCATYAIGGIGYAPAGAIRRAGAPGRADGGERPAEETGAGAGAEAGVSAEIGAEIGAGPGAAPAAAPRAPPDLAAIARAGVLCNDAELRETPAGWQVEGDAMEGALLALAAKAGADPAALRGAAPRLDEIPFDAEHRFMATLHAAGPGRALVLVKGAPERVVAMSAREAEPGGEVAIDRARWLRAAEELAARGERVIALAQGELDGGTPFGPSAVEGGLTLLGLVGFLDPPRAEAVAAVAECRAAGIRVVMITGDHAVTAREIARQLGLAPAPEVLTGADLDRLDDDGLARAVTRAAVFARTTPEHKLRLVGALQARGLTVAMTGDGVNDAPALRRADVGIAMGAKGAETSKAAAEIVLADDNFASIVAAVREGRTAYENVRKVIGWTLPTNGGEAVTVLLALALGWTLPITPVQILWVNMVTAVALGLTLAFEPVESGTMRRPPRPRGTPILGGGLAWRVAYVTGLFALFCFAIFFWAEARGLPVEAGRTLVVNTLVGLEIAYLLVIRIVGGAPVAWASLAWTPATLIGIALTLALQAAFSGLPAMQALFGTAPVPVEGWLAVLAAALAFVAIVLIESQVSAGLRSRQSPARSP